MSLAKNFVLPLILVITILLSIFERSYFSFKYPALILLIFLTPFFFIISFEYFKEIKFQLVMCIVFLSFYNFSSLPFEFNLKEIIFLIVFLCDIAILFIYFSETGENIKVGFSSFDKFLLYTFSVLFIISAFLFNQQDSFSVIGFSKYGAYLFSMFIIPVVTFHYFSKNPKMIDKFIWIITVWGLITALFGIVTYFMPSVNRYNMYPGTTISYFKHPNATSSIYNFTIPCAFFLLLFRKKFLSDNLRLFLIITIVISFIGLFFTFSRFGTVSVIVSLLLLFYRYSKQYTLLILLFLPIVTFFFIYDFFLLKGTGTLFTRAGILATTIEMLRGPTANLLWGYGIVSTTEIFESIKISLKVPDLNNVPHNIILYSILQFGLIPTIPITIFVFKKTISFFIAFFKDKCTEYQILSYSIIIFLVFKNMGEDLLIFPDFVLYYLFLVFWGISFLKFDSSHELNKIRESESLANG